MANFLWSGKPDSRKFITVAWDKVCKPREEGGLGIRRFRDVNFAMLMKLGWQILNKESEWCRYLFSCFCKKVEKWNLPIILHLFGLALERFRVRRF